MITDTEADTISDKEPPLETIAETNEEGEELEDGLMSSQAYYVRKMDYSKMKVIIDEEEIAAVEKTLTNFKLLILIIKRLSNCYTHAEKYILEREHKVAFDLLMAEGAGNKYTSLTRLRGLVRNWKKMESKEFSKEEFDEIMSEINHSRLYFGNQVKMGIRLFTFSQRMKFSFLELRF